MRSRRLPSDGEEGFSLIELLVVIILMGALGAITTAGLATAMRNTRQDSARVNNAEALETQLQRLIKQVRTADPIRFGSTPTSSTSAVVVDLYPATGCQRVEWRVSGGNLQQRIQSWNATSACLLYPATAAVTSDTGYVTKISNITSATPFSYLDSAGTLLASPTAATAKQVSVTLTQSQPENRAAISLTASTYMRNTT